MNDLCNNNLKNLCRMSRAWKNNNDVDIKGITIDVLAYNFISNYIYKDKSYLYYDYLSRDFFKYLSEVDKNQYKWLVMGSNRYIYDFGKFRNKAKVAYNNCLDAIIAETDGNSTKAKEKWKEIYGSKIK